ncbi:hypothetical protein [Streptomyces sp. NPDC018000]
MSTSNGSGRRSTVGGRELVRSFPLGTPFGLAWSEAERTENLQGA